MRSFWSLQRSATRKLAGIAVLLRAAAGIAHADAPELMLSIESPEPGAVIGDPGGMAFLSGKALALFGEYQTFDIAFVIDTSESTAAPSGADIDGDGKVGTRAGSSWLSIFGQVLPLPNTDRGDSVLAAEIAAVKTLLEQLDPRTTRVGVTAFSGDRDVMTPDAYTVVPLTTDFDRVRKGLDDLLDYGPNGMTNMAEGVDRGIIELIGSRSAYSEPRIGARRVMLFLTDGTPTLPYVTRRDNIREAISRASRAARWGVRIDTYAIGEEALQEPIVAIEMARVTNGRFTPVREPRNLRAIFENLDFAQIAELKITNLTTKGPASYSIQNPDGSFAALVPMREGSNVVEVFARATDGSQARERIKLRFLAERRAQELPPRLVAQRNRLLENHLLDLQRRRLKIELDRDEEIRRELMVEIDRERKAAQARAEAAKRRLQIEVEK